jgi:hypothetical protein
MRLATGRSILRSLRWCCVRSISTDFKTESDPGQSPVGIWSRRWTKPHHLRWFNPTPQEYTFSLAYSNYDCDQGTLTLPMSRGFNVGLNRHIELFFKSNGWRDEGKRAKNLSGFYLPNYSSVAPCQAAASDHFAYCSNTGILAGRPVFRPQTPTPSCSIRSWAAMGHWFDRGWGQFGFRGSGCSLDRSGGANRVPYGADTSQVSVLGRWPPAGVVLATQVLPQRR